MCRGCAAGSPSGRCTETGCWPGTPPLLQERLRHRDPADHERGARLKAHVFDYLLDSASLRIAWAEQAIDILHGRLGAALPTGGA